MAFYLAAILVFCLLIVWMLAGFIVFDIPVLIIEWLSNQPWGNDPWIERLIHWFTIPSLWLLLFFLLWGLLVIIYGRPMAVLGKKGIRGGDRFWQSFFRLIACRYNPGDAQPFHMLKFFAWMGVFFAAGACVVALVKPDHPVIWLRHPSIPLVGFLVAHGMGQTIKQSLKLLKNAGEMSGGVKAEPKDAEETAESNLREDASDTFKVITRDEKKIKKEPPDDGIAE